MKDIINMNTSYIIYKISCEVYLYHQHLFSNISCTISLFCLSVCLKHVVFLFFSFSFFNPKSIPKFHAELYDYIQINDISSDPSSVYHP